MRRPNPTHVPQPSSGGDALLDDMVAMMARLAARAVDGGAAPTTTTPTTSPPMDGACPRASATRSPRRRRDDADCCSAPRSPRRTTRSSRAPPPAPAPAEQIDDTTELQADGVGLQQTPLTVREIAGLINASEDVTRNLLRRQNIAGFKVGGQWRAMPAAVSEYIVAQLARR